MAVSALRMYSSLGGATMTEFMFIPILAGWFVSQLNDKPSYHREADRKYSVSPLFGQPRATLLREAQKPRS
jgi:hypothetical protein